MWIQVNDATNQVTRAGDTKLSPRPDTSDYRVSRDDYISAGEYDTVYFDGAAFSVVHDNAAHRMSIEPALIVAYRKWQDALALSLECVNMCKAEYDALKAEYDAIGG